MAYQLRYRLEFDTIKGRNVRLDIEEFRNLPPASETFLAYFIADSAPNEIIISNGLMTNDLPNYIVKGDTITISSTLFNNGTYTVTGYEIYVGDFLDGQAYLAKITVEETLTIEIDTENEIILEVTTGEYYQDLTPSGQSPIELSYPNGEFDKMCPIRESKMRIKILSDVVTFQDFVVTSDTQFKVSLFEYRMW